MGGNFAARLNDLAALTPGEQETLGRLETRERPLRRGAVLIRENDPSTQLFVIQKGLMMSYVLLDDGSRQILDFLFPGDLIGMCSLAYGTAAETMAAVTDCTVCSFERSEIATLLIDHPRLAGLILVIAQIERVALTDRLAGLGRTSAKARVAALLLELRDRLRRTDQGIADSFTIPLTQEEIGDATGLTAVHVNRMLRQLEEEKMIAREGSRVTLLSEQGLARLRITSAGRSSTSVGYQRRVDCQTSADTEARLARQTTPFPACIAADADAAAQSR